MSTASTSARPPLSPGLWIFVVWKGVGVLWSCGYVAFALVWAVPMVLRTEFAADFALELGVHAAEAVVTTVGIMLIFRRYRGVRHYWVILLALYCLLRTAEVFLSEESVGAAILLLTGAGWLGYWLSAAAPHQLAFNPFWTNPLQVQRAGPLERND